ncbi:unnamed protein product [Amoebophrya sp. A25]|nr:unnamed protein product [Amoebophrya sp. A25]|eukprot:GSA25T00004370001.1
MSMPQLETCRTRKRSILSLHSIPLWSIGGMRMATRHKKMMPIFGKNCVGRGTKLMGGKVTMPLLGLLRLHMISLREKNLDPDSRDTVTFFAGPVVANLLRWSL